MDLFNNTPLTAAVDISGADNAFPRFCQVTAKATFTFDAEGRVELDMQNPVPIFKNDEETPLGVLPSDAMLHVDGTFSVIVLAAAYSPHPIDTREVSLDIGKERRTLLVNGDRFWRPDGRQTAPMPFTRMPLIYDLAFGGSCDVMIDEKSPLTLSWPYNPMGKGFDPTRDFQGLGIGIACPQGFPKLPEGYERALPNVENPADPVRLPTDTPLPAGWGALSPGSPLYTMPWLEAHSNADPKLPDPVVLPKAFLYRCHPDWLITPPPAKSCVTMQGITPEEQIRFLLPDQNVSIDYTLGVHTGQRSLVPFMLVLLADEKRFYLVYRFSFEYRFSLNEERSLCLRYKQG